jgi:hypothetical protein
MFWLIFALQYLLIFADIFSGQHGGGIFIAMLWCCYGLVIWMEAGRRADILANIWYAQLKAEIRSSHGK